MSPKHRPASRPAAKRAQGRPGQGRPIRVVPLHLPGAAAPALRAPAAAQLTYRGGPLLTSVRVITVFWGDAWTQAPQQGTVSSLNDFFQFIVASTYLDQMAEYSVPGQAIGRGALAGTATIPDALAATVTDEAVQQLVEGRVADGSLPPATANSLYFVFLPPGVTVVSGNEQSCQVFCGYHDRSAGGLYYAVVPWPDCSGCLGGLQPLDALTSVASHELGEAITDPVPGQGWYDDSNGENGDICAWQNKTLGAYTVQKLWSNRAGACV